MKAEVSGEESAVPGLDWLARERQPNPDLWAGIESRLAAPARPRRREASVWPYALAASLSAVLLTGVLLREPSPLDPKAAGLPPAETVVALPQAGSAQPRPYSHMAMAAAPSAAMLSQALRTLRSESRDNAPALVAERADAASGLMKATYAPRSSHTGQGQQAILRAHLKLTVQAEREVRRALKVEPDSESLNSLLAVAQVQRAELTALLIHARD